MNKSNITPTQYDRL